MGRFALLLLLLCPFVAEAKTHTQWLLECTAEAKALGESDKIIDIGPPHHEVCRTVLSNTMAEQVPKYLSLKGDWQKMHLATGAGAMRNERLKVGITDTGVSSGLIDVGELVRVGAKVDFTGGNDWRDYHGHGTWCACAIAAQNNGKGIIGVAPEVELVIAKSLDNQGRGSVIGIAASIRWMADQGCDIISASLGGPESQVVATACNYAMKKGVLVFVSMGNDAHRTSGHPGNDPSTIGVMAIDYNWQLASFSSWYRGSKPEVITDFGVQAVSCGLCGPLGCQLQWNSGTSMSCPVGAGTAANVVSWLLRNGKPRPKNNREYIELIKPHCRKLGEFRKFGIGWFDIVSLIDSTTPTPDPIEPLPPPVEVNGVFIVIVDGVPIWIKSAKPPKYQPLTRAELLELVNDD